jgi:heme/copper-type cytochrome/quinol oxidase subunit 2
MIKEVFEIEPIQKNSLITLGCLTCISYLQLDLFAHHVKLDNIFTSLMLSFALSICWLISNSISCFLFFRTSIHHRQDNPPVMERVVLILGSLTISWVIVYTYIGYEFDLTFRQFIRVSLLITIVRTVFWGIWLISKNNNDKSQQKTE